MIARSLLRICVHTVAFVTQGQLFAPHMDQNFLVKPAFSKINISGLQGCSLEDINRESDLRLSETPLRDIQCSSRRTAVIYFDAFIFALLSVLINFLPSLPLTIMFTRVPSMTCLIMIMPSGFLFVGRARLPRIIFADATLLRSTSVSVVVIGCCLLG